MVYYTLTPRSGPNKTARAAVLYGSMFSKPCAPAQGRVQCTRAAAQAAALGLLYPDAAQRPQQNRMCCGFTWFNVLKALCAGTGACAVHTCSRASGGFGVIIPWRRAAAPTKPHVLRFCMVQCSQSPVRQHRGVCRAHAQPHKRRLWGYYTL